MSLGSRKSFLGSGDTCSSVARYRRCRYRALFSGLFAVLLAFAAYGEEPLADCHSQPESQKPLCLMVQACSVIDDEARRRECYRIAVESLADVEIPGSPPSVAEAVEAPAAERQPVGDASTSEAPASGKRDLVDGGSDNDGEQRSSSTQEVAERTSTLTAIGRLFTRSRQPDPGDEIPKRFIATVTVHRDLVRDRQLIVLDDKLLFEGDNAASSHIKVGDEVDVVKMSISRGRRYQIIGPSRRAFSALRIRCERQDLSVANRRKCEGTMAKPGNSTK